MSGTIFAANSSMRDDERYPMLPSMRVRRERRPLTREELEVYFYRGWIVLDCLEGGIVKLVTYMPCAQGDIRFEDKVECTPSCYNYVKRILQSYQDAYKVTKRLLKRRGWKPKKRPNETNTNENNI